MHVALDLTVAPGLLNSCRDGVVVTFEPGCEADELRDARRCSPEQPFPQDLRIPVLEDLPKLSGKLFGTGDVRM